MEIEKDVPVPERFPAVHKNIVGGRKKYPFEEMDVGDSFFVEGPKAGLYGQRFRGAVSHRNNRNNRDGKRFIVRAVEDGYRCWRVE